MWKPLLKRPYTPHRPHGHHPLRRQPARRWQHRLARLPVVWAANIGAGISDFFDTISGTISGTVLAAILGSTIVAPTRAQAQYFGNFIDDLSSPLLTPAVAAFITGSAITGAAAQYKKTLGDPIQNEETARKRLGKTTVYFDYAGRMIPNVAYWGLFLGVGLLTDSDREVNRSSQMLRSSAYSILITTILKHTIRQPRPGSPNEKNAFPSGHATTAFAFATTVAANHAWYWGVGAYTMASLVAYSRISDNRHYLHDVLGGATVGISYGLGVFFRDKKANRLAQNLDITPIIDLENAGIRLTLRF